MYNNDLLYNFLCILDHGGFTSASKATYSTQSTVSAKLSRLEEQVGHTLLTRNRRGLVSLTPQGKEIELLARETQRLHALTYRKLNSKMVSGTVRVGLSDDIASAGNYPYLLAEFCHQQPGIQLEVSVGSGPDLQRSLERGEVDHVMIKMTGDLPLGTVELWREDLCWVGRSSTYRVPQDILPLVTFTPPCRYRERAISILEKCGYSLRIAYVTPSLNGVLAAVTAGLGLSLLPGSLVTDQDLIIPAKIFPHPGWISFAALSRSDINDKANQVFKELLEHFPRPQASSLMTAV